MFEPQSPCTPSLLSQALLDFMYLLPSENTLQKNENATVIRITLPVWTSDCFFTVGLPIPACSVCEATYIAPDQHDITCSDNVNHLFVLSDFKSRHAKCPSLSTGLGFRLWPWRHQTGHRDMPSCRVNSSSTMRTDHCVYTL